MMLAALLRKQNVDVAAHEAATSFLNLRAQPTEAQAQAGNYKKGHVRISGLDISIENPAGSKRRPEWPTLQSHYGYIKGTRGADDGHLDVFVRPGTPEDWNGDLYVIDQHVDGKFDEHKVMLGWDNEADARKAYLANYERGWDGIGAVTRMTQDEFKMWMEGDTTQPVQKAEWNEEDHPRDERGEFTNSVSAESIAIMKKYKDQQADDSVIKQFMEANGLTLADYKNANEVLYAHNIASGEASDRALSALWHSDSAEGKALRLMSQWQEWQAQHALHPEPLNYAAMREAAKKAAEEGRWDSFRAFREGGDLSPTVDRYLTLLAAKERGESVFYRKGSLDKAAISTSTDKRGATSGGSNFKPDRFFTFSEMKAAGYHLLSGQRGVVGVTSAAEMEHIWLRPQAQKLHLTSNNGKLCACALHKNAPVVTNVGKYVAAKQDKVSRKIARLLKEHGKALAALAAELYGKGMQKLAKDATTDELVQAILDELDAQGVAVDVVDSITPELIRAFAKAGVLGVGQVSIGMNDDITNHLDQAALDYAEKRGAELVKDLAGTTIEDLRGTISDAVEEGWSADRLSSEIQDLGAFGEARADTIARTELAFAHVQGNVEGWRETGQVVGKQWILGDLHAVDDECDDNLADGVIGFDEEFSSGDLWPPAHPNCICDVLPILEGEM